LRTRQSTIPFSGKYWTERKNLFMNEKLLKYLFDIKLAIEEIDSYFKTEPRNFDNYRQNSLLKRAIERNLEIIGEALNRIIKEDPDFTIENAKRIIGLRNQIIHGYDSISDENIWGILSIHLPKLKSDIELLIK
jgi:uncharacterized protein with HEPN domain